MPVRCVTAAAAVVGRVQVSVDGPSRTTVNAAGMKQGAACFQYVAMHPGVYTISATIDGRHINNSPATVTASIAKPCAPNCEVLPTSTRHAHQHAGWNQERLCRACPVAAVAPAGADCHAGGMCPGLRSGA